MERPDRYLLMMQTARLWASRSTCSRMAVGAVIHRDFRILVQGYNGSPAGLPHCDYEHGSEACLAVHAEQNAIAWAAREGVALHGSSMVCTHQPCLSCARSIINAGIKSVMFDEEYRLHDGLNLLLQARVQVLRSIDGDLPEMVRFSA